MISIKMKNNKTNEIKDIQDDLQWNSDFIWAAGNFACDCNRHLFFNNFDCDDIDCSDYLYTIISIHDQNGNLVYSET